MIEISDFSLIATTPSIDEDKTRTRENKAQSHQKKPDTFGA